MKFGIIRHDNPQASGNKQHLESRHGLHGLAINVVGHRNIKADPDVLPLYHLDEPGAIHMAGEHLLSKGDGLGERYFFNEADINQLVADGSKR